jgi:hypothetical protein
LEAVKLGTGETLSKYKTVNEFNFLVIMELGVKTAKSENAISIKTNKKIGNLTSGKTAKMAKKVIKTYKNQRKLT